MQTTAFTLTGNFAVTLGEMKRKQQILSERTLVARCYREHGLDPEK